MDEVQLIIDIFQSVGMWSVFFYLYMQERKDRKEAQRAHFEDLRDIAGVSPRLPQNRLKSGNLTNGES